MYGLPTSSVDQGQHIVELGSSKSRGAVLAFLQGAQILRCAQDDSSAEVRASGEGAHSGDQDAGDAQHRVSPLGIDVSKWTLDVRLEHPCPRDAQRD